MLLISTIPIPRSPFVRLQEHKINEPTVLLLVHSYSSTIERKLTPKYDYILPTQEPTFTVKYIQTYK